MQEPLIYGISFGSLLLLAILIQGLRSLNGKTYELFASLFRKNVIQTLVLCRQKGSSDFTVFYAIILLVFVTSNSVILLLPWPLTASDLAGRSSSLFIINAVPLYIGSSNYVSEKVIRLSKPQRSLIHRWIGRVCVVLALIHSMCHLKTGLRTTFDSYSLLGIVAVLSVSSLLYVRRYIYDTFQVTHNLSSVALLALLWIHVIRQGDRLVIASLALATAIWIINKIIWLVLMAYRNGGDGERSTAAIEALRLDGSIRAVRVCITVRRAWEVKAGHYIYITLPGHLRTLAQSHPYSIAWAEGHTLVLLVSARSGFSKSLTTHIGDCRVVLDGPYGETAKLHNYDTVLFMSYGIGIVTQLLSVRDLLRGHDDQTARVRRVTMVWFLESSEQEAWASEYIEQLQSMDKRQILTVIIYAPGQNQVVEVQDDSKGVERLRQIRVSRSLDMRWLLDSEWNAEAGSMAVGLCGPPLFERKLRTAVRSMKQDIHVFGGDYEVDETMESQTAMGRVGDSANTPC